MSAGWIVCLGEKKFSAKTHHSTRTRWQTEVIRVRSYTLFNRGYHYILIVIDVLNKYIWAESLKAESGNKVTRAIIKIIRNDGRCPKNLHTDREKEFYNSDMQKLLKKHNINHYSTYSVMKISVVERFNYTLMNDMWKQFMYNGNGSTSCRVSSNYKVRKHRNISSTLPTRSLISS